MPWLTRLFARSSSTTRRPVAFSRSTRLCAETLAGIADPLFPALTAARVVPPDQAARAMLGAMAASVESPADTATPAWLLPHQAEAVQRSRGILDRFGGVLIADGVGLGKTYIALALAALERERGGDAVAFVPASLRDEWRRACSTTGVPLAVHSHTDLARRPPVLLERCRLMLVDEAHAFRNPRTRRYDALARLAAGRRVALLTATPFNNAPADLAALLHLFAPRDRFREFGVPDLPRALRSGDPAAALALAAVSVSRTRRLVEQRFPDLAGAFPKRRLEPPVRYDLRRCYGRCLPLLLDALDELLAVQDRAERGAALMHLGLLRRLESSRAAFRRSLLRQRDFLAEVARAAEGGVRLDRGAYRAAVPRGEQDDTQLVMWTLLADPAGGRENARDLEPCLRSVERALTLLEAAGEADDKIIALERLLDASLAGLRTIVFTEHRDTALYLLRTLRLRRRVIAVVGDSAWAGATPISRGEALDAFAPRSRGARAGPLLQADVLLATDVASEGLNLQDAQAVVNYDLPWNPVRVMQRVGRIDRIGSPHREVVVAHLLPAGGLADLTGVLRRTRVKLEAAGATLASEPDPLATLWWLDGGALTPEAIQSESWKRVAVFEARERWRALAGPPAPPPSARRPLIAAALADDHAPPQAGLLLALEWPDARRVCLPFVSTAGAAPKRDPEALGALAERALRSRPLAADPGPFTSLLASVLPEARRCLPDLSAARHGTDEIGPGRRAVLAELRALAARAVKSRADTRLLERATALLERELPAGLDRMLDRLARGPVNENLPQRTVEVLESGLPPAPPPLHGAPRLVLVAAIVVATGCPSAS